MDFDSFAVDEKRNTPFKEWAECREIKDEMIAYCQAHLDRQFAIGKDNYQASPKQFYWIKRTR